MKTSLAGKKLIKEFEACSLKPYQDKTGNWTIGYGHLITFQLNGTTKTATGWEGTISQYVADYLFDQDLMRFEDHINSKLVVHINQRQFDSLMSLDFNKGYSAGDAVILHINKNDLISAAWTFLDFISSKGVVLDGLKKRRILESANFLGGTSYGF